MRIIITGSITLDDKYPVLQGFANLLKESSAREVTEVITCGGTGVDAVGKEIAERFDIAHREMASHEGLSIAAALVLVWDGTSPRGASMKAGAEKHNLQIVEVIL